MQTVRELYDGEVATLRADHTLQEIGDKCGVSRQRIKQILDHFYRDRAHLTVLTSGQIALRLGISAARMSRLCEKNNIIPIRKAHHAPAFYSQDVPLRLAEIIASAVCKVCGKHIEWPRISYCSDECYKVYENSRYSRSLEFRQTHAKAIKRWAEKNPEKLKAINRRTQEKRAAKLRANRKYIIVGECEIPIGAIVKNAGKSMNVRLPVEWNGNTYFIRHHLLKIYKAEDNGQARDL